MCVYFIISCVGHSCVKAHYANDNKNSTRLKNSTRKEQVV